VDVILTWVLLNVKQQCQLLDHNIQSGACTEVALGQISLIIWLFYTILSGYEVKKTCNLVMEGN
jgi:hypothetical protein